MTMQMSELGRTRGVSNGGIRKNQVAEVAARHVQGGSLVSAEFGAEVRVRHQLLCALVDT